MLQAQHHHAFASQQLADRRCCHRQVLIMEPSMMLLVQLAQISSSELSNHRPVSPMIAME